MLEIKREQLWILTISVYVKTGPMIVTWSSQKNFLHYAMNNFDKKTFLLFQNKKQIHRKTVDELTYIH